MLSYISSTGQERKGNDLNTETFNPGQTQVRSLFLSGWTFNANALHLACEEADSDAHTNTHTQTHTHTEIHTLHRYLILHTIHGIPLQYDTRQYSTWHCITFYTLHYITAHYITFHYSTLHYIRIQQVVHRTTLHTLHKVSLHDIELHYITLPHSMLGVYRTPLCVQLKWPSLSKFSGIWNISSDISAPRVPARPCSCGMLYIYIHRHIPSWVPRKLHIWRFPGPETNGLHGKKPMYDVEVPALCCQCPCISKFVCCMNHKTSHVGTVNGAKARTLDVSLGRADPYTWKGKRQLARETSHWQWNAFAILLELLD